MAFFSGSKKLCMFEIRYAVPARQPYRKTPKLTPARPEVDFVVFRGNPEDTTPYTLKGHVILMTNDSIQNKSVKIAFKGKRRTSYALVPQCTI